MWPNPRIPVDLVLYTEEILNRKVIFCTELFVEWIPPPFNLFAIKPKRCGRNLVYKRETQKMRAGHRIHHALASSLSCKFEVTVPLQSSSLKDSISCDSCSDLLHCLLCSSEISLFVGIGVLDNFVDNVIFIDVGVPSSHGVYCRGQENQCFSASLYKRLGPLFKCKVNFVVLQ